MTRPAKHSNSELWNVLNKHGIDQVKISASCPDEWLPLIDQLTGDLIVMGWDRDLHQIKSKFGSLRYYIGAGTEEMYSLIRAVENSTAGSNTGFINWGRN